MFQITTLLSQTENHLRKNKQNLKQDKHKILGIVTGIGKYLLHSELKAMGSKPVKFTVNNFGEMQGIMKKKLRR